ncbi:Uma2 family endonuclease [Oscillatoria acuminata]|uniref:Putative restriction endonuclease domain-containing protein n=1 Tax=Oscillatoria acuminata PCC 6304 TaxID=56110 RepID=K9TE15_9CYAN|nr:Uma2 family endonuclease [Oscillatoria acuminata]AFY80366.1 hypothetical protein Oscil6304_0626 [Oscillatoria acuminata PCC 6304]
MNTPPAVPETSPLVLQLSPAIEMTDEQFFYFCQQNRDYLIERTSQGEIIIMPPTGSETGNRNFDLIIQLGIWTRQNKTGIGFDSSTGFTLPNGSIKSSDAAWINLEKWNRLTPEQQQKFAPICPDFVIKFRSPSDNLKRLQDKLQDYIEQGTLLGWLIDRKHQQVYIYRPNQPVDCLTQPTTLSEESVLPGFVLDLSTIW